MYAQLDCAAMVNLFEQNKKRSLVVVAEKKKAAIRLDQRDSILVAVSITINTITTRL